MTIKHKKNERFVIRIYYYHKNNNNRRRFNYINLFFNVRESHSYKIYILYAISITIRKTIVKKKELKTSCLKHYVCID